MFLWISRYSSLQSIKNLLCLFPVQTLNVFDNHDWSIFPSTIIILPCLNASSSPHELLKFSNGRLGGLAGVHVPYYPLFVSLLLSLSLRLVLFEYHNHVSTLGILTSPSAYLLCISESLHLLSTPAHLVDANLMASSERLRLFLLQQCSSCTGHWYRKIYVQHTVGISKRPWAFLQLAYWLGFSWVCCHAFKLGAERRGLSVIKFHDGYDFYDSVPALQWHREKVQSLLVDALSSRPKTPTTHVRAPTGHPFSWYTSSSKMIRPLCNKCPPETVQSRDKTFFWRIQHRGTEHWLCSYWSFCFLWV